MRLIQALEIIDDLVASPGPSFCFSGGSGRLDGGKWSLPGTNFEPGALNRLPMGRGAGSEMSERLMSDEFDGLDATEKAGVGAALNRCRVLAAKIANELRNKRPEHFVDQLSLAEVHASLERAADVLSTVKGSRRPQRRR
jgi:hypothetical protein